MISMLTKSSSLLQPVRRNTSWKHCLSTSTKRSTVLSSSTTLWQPQQQQQQQQQQQEKVCIIGSGNWASAISIHVGNNCQRLSFCDSQVRMWVHDEDVQVPNANGTSSITRKLSDVINSHHENVKYLAGYSLPHNVVAVPNLEEACEGATLLIFCLPHQFLPSLLPTIRTVVMNQRSSNMIRGVSLIKGLDFDPVKNVPIRVSESIEKGMSLQAPDTDTSTSGGMFPCGVLMGANVANEVAAGQFCESTLASNFGESLNEQTRLVFHNDNVFRVRHIPNVASAEACGALKNVFALGAGYVDGCDYGGNTKASLLRVALVEMSKFCTLFFGNNTSSNTPAAPVEDSYLLQSCGMADLITTCYGGRNRRCAEVFARYRRASETINSSSEELWQQIESEQLQGQKLQGTHAAQGIFAAIQQKGAEEDFPLIRTIYDITFHGKPVESILDGIVVV